MTEQLSRDELLVLLIEDCDKTKLAALKCREHGFDTVDPIYGIQSTRLAMACGDVIGIINALPLHLGVMEREARTRIERAVAAKNARKPAGPYEKESA